MDTRSGSYINYLISISHDIFVMFDNYDRIPEIHQLPQIVEEETTITRMESYRGFIEDIGDSFEPRSYLSCEPDTLRFTS